MTDLIELSEKDNNEDADTKDCTMHGDLELLENIWEARDRLGDNEPMQGYLVD